MKTNTILIVDDEKDLLAVLEKAIQTLGCTTLCASNGEEALRIIEKQRPDLVLLDVMMPELDGWELCKILKDNTVYRSIKVIMLTAKDTPMDRLVGKEILRADEYMTKPFEIGRILAACRRLLQSGNES